ncbi:hydrolase [Thermosulfuriphilus ammonigenes]|uniref:Hydrolase n=1 Tax=Thermosulfuriphilus ammonigenes TaxID=1936021 RepID=A0A6G7PU60_9BACT|nr:hydrolase [Thermosulfuriphilus ammonigenes]MBA2848643.1 nicotinamidase-related amidase [Thermosulfuriphilus ammonigenes]QIJ71219.1 hydrolase [Thermosulfuriphilus ammonigenes]HFB83391.1 hydrolase [Thermodesulfatator sp.]
MKAEFLKTEDLVLVVVDPQERLMAAIHEAQRVEKNISLLIRLAQNLEIPIIPTTQYVKGLGPYVPDLGNLLGGTKYYDKVEFNALDNPEIRSALADLGRKELLLCGVETHICVYQTALGALKEGYSPRVVADATSSRRPENMAYGLEYLRQLAVAVVSTEMVIYELLRKAGTPAFKAMLPYLK